LGVAGPRGDDRHRQLDLPTGAQVLPDHRQQPLGDPVGALRAQPGDRVAHLRDTVARLCAESSDRIPKWLLPVIRENLRTGGEIELSVAVIASWARYAE